MRVEGQVLAAKRLREVPLSSNPTAATGPLPGIRLRALTTTSTDAARWSVPTFTDDPRPQAEIRSGDFI